MRYWVYILLFGITAWMTGCDGDSTHKAIRKSIEKQMEMYPQSTLKDLYKNYFQDNFGPGHIIANNDAADKYLRQELSSIADHQGADYEYTGYKGNMVRVNLRVIADGRVPYEIYLDAFIRSVNGITPPSIEQWRQEWAKIDSIIIATGIKLNNADEERNEINELLLNGNVVMHHSKQFNQHYAPHYRIIERNIFEQDILPLIKQHK